MLGSTTKSKKSRMMKCITRNLVNIARMTYIPNAIEIHLKSNMNIVCDQGEPQNEQ